MPDSLKVLGVAPYYNQFSWF